MTLVVVELIKPRFIIVQLLITLTQNSKAENNAQISDSIFYTCLQVGFIEMGENVFLIWKDNAVKVVKCKLSGRKKKDKVSMNLEWERGEEKVVDESER